MSPCQQVPSWLAAQVGAAPRAVLVVYILRWRVAAPGGRWREEIMGAKRETGDRMIGLGIQVGARLRRVRGRTDA
ncbi:MAG: hypothetical protein EBQ59_00365 [Verrucomicrobia bacterium]|nr:hypothetical protein [Verrucomicrobiota bacterium]